MSALESVVLTRILDVWSRHPRVWIWRNNTGAVRFGSRYVQFGKPGAPDIMGVLAPGGRAMGIECKSDTGRQSAQQKRWQADFERCGGLYILARRIEDVSDVLVPLVGASEFVGRRRVIAR